MVECTDWIFIHQEQQRTLGHYPITVPIAFRAGKIDGSMRAKGLPPLGDLLIGATALEIGYAVVTHNIRHFQMIPGLEVKQL